ncbi:MAG: 2-oxoacid:ferredoxin oxidoreductase subunit beta [Candidatus Neomarinimicrobiota bacterium]|nr:MAG: 2-oxoacid:ferredoxin oxidoreductase subunit beta [Candidatus Neomarinimicrobiota bacterium]
MNTSPAKPLTRADFASDQAVRWCPGCGDYAILAQTQKVFPLLGLKREDFVVVSGIGCSSRFPYYMETYGFHSIHGRAAAIATGVKLANPDLSVWVITGDGDALSIGGNHTVHLLRRNLDINMMLFNNRIYGLTKGQYSPTSELGKITKSSPYGSLDNPFNPPSFALGAHATFIARTIDRETHHMQDMLKRCYEHKGSSFLEIYQNCLIFNDGAYTPLTDRETKSDRVLWLEHGKPMVFGKDNNKGIHLNGNVPEVIELGSQWSIDDVVVHDETDFILASMLSDFTYNDAFPDPIGVFYAIEKPTYDELMMQQIDEVIRTEGRGDLKALLNAGETWLVE